MNLKKVFEECKINEYCFEEFNTEESLDNIQSLDYYWSFVFEDFDENFIIADNGTQAIIKHKDYEFEIQVDSGGRGDFFSHIIEFSKL